MTGLSGRIGRALLVLLALCFLADGALARSGGGFGGGGGRSGGFGGGSRSSFSSSRSSAPRAAPAPRATPPAPRATTAPASNVTVSPSARTNDAATAAMRRSQSAATYRAATPSPKPSFTTATGKRVNVGGTQAASTVRNTLSPLRYENRAERQRMAYPTIPDSSRPVIINQYGGGAMGDPFSGLFMYALLSQSLSNQAAFHHNHWGEYSEERRAKLLAENAELKAELDKLKDQPRDTKFVPAGTDPDLIYSDEFVEAAYNPEPPKRAMERAPSEDEAGVGMVLVWAGLLGLVGLGGWWVFVYRSEV
jgi:hypothetical protein